MARFELRRIEEDAPLQKSSVRERAIQIRFWTLSLRRHVDENLP
jgi:hypothetical protein